MPGRKPLCIKTLAAMFVTAVFAVLAARDARTDMWTNKDFLCQYVPDTAYRAMKNKDYRKAAGGFTKAIEWTEKNCDPDDWKLASLQFHYRDRAQAYARLGDFERAAKDIETLRDKFDLKYLRDGDRDIDWIFAALDGAVKASPKDPSLRGLRADVYDWYITYMYDWYRKKHANAPKKETVLAARLADRNAQIRLARSDAEKAEALEERSVIYRYTEKKPELALADISAAIELDPQAHYYKRRAEYLGQAKLEMALADMSKAVMLAPEDKKWLFLKARAGLYEQSGQYDEAIDDLTEVISTAPYSGSERRDRAKLLRKANRLNEADKEYSELVSKSPKDAKLQAEWLLVLIAQGNDRGAERLRKKIEKLNPEMLDQPWFARELAAAGAGPAEPAASPAALREAWAMGEVVAVTPLQHLIGKPNATADKAWDMTSNFVRAGQEEAGRPPRGLGKIPEFKGSKSAQVNQSIRFILRQSKAVEGALEKKFGTQAGAVFAVSSAGYLVSTLNRMGVAKLNDRLGEMIKAEGPSSGLPRDVWADTAAKTAARAKPEEVVKAWVAGSKAARDFLTKPEKKSVALSKARKPKAERGAVEKKGVKPPEPLRKCDDLDALYFDPGTTPPCQP